MISAPVSPLRQRMIEDMAIRQFEPKTRHDYVRVVADFARFLGRSPDRAEPEDLGRYRLSRMIRRTQPSSQASLARFGSAIIGHERNRQAGRGSSWLRHALRRQSA